DLYVMNLVTVVDVDLLFNRTIGYCQKVKKAAEDVPRLAADHRDNDKSDITDCVKDVAYLLFFSSRRRHTRSKRDLSSDVCSSDLLEPRVGAPAFGRHRDVVALGAQLGAICERYVTGGWAIAAATAAAGDAAATLPPWDELVAEIGRASCRERGEKRVVVGCVEKAT